MRVNVPHVFGNFDVEASTLAPVNTVRNLGISFDPELSFIKQTDTVVKNCNFQIHNIQYKLSGNFWIESVINH